MQTPTEYKERYDKIEHFLILKLCKYYEKMI